MRLLVAVVACLVLGTLVAGDAIINPCIGQSIGASFCQGDFSYVVCKDASGGYDSMNVALGTRCVQQTPTQIAQVNAAPGTYGVCAGRVSGQYCSLDLKSYYSCPSGVSQPMAAGTKCQQNNPVGGSPYVTLVHDNAAASGPAYCQGKPVGQYCTDDFKGYYVCPGGQYQPMAPGTVCAYLSLDPPAVVGVFPKTATSCSAIKSANPTATDGDYIIYIQGSPSKPLAVYCADMNSGPKEFVRLHPPPSSISALSQSNSIRISTTFSMVRLILSPLLIDNCNLRFAATSPSYTGYLGLGTTCNCFETAQSASSVVDLRGTGLRLAAGKNNLIFFGYGTDTGLSVTEDATSFQLRTTMASNKCMCVWKSSIGTNAADCGANCLRVPNTSDGQLVPGLQKCDYFYGNTNNYKTLAVEVPDVATA